MDSTWKWLSSKAGQKTAQDAKDKAWAEFKRRYPRADLTKFTTEVSIDDSHNVTADAMFEAGPGGLMQSVSGSDPKYRSQTMKDALGLVKDGFPFQLTLNKNPERPIPAVDFSASAQRVGNVFNKEQKIYATPMEFFKTNFRNIFKDTKITHITGKEAKKWLAGPNMSYWPQQLNFAVWCARTGSGISMQILFELKFSPQLRSFSLFHVYFTIRRILFEMGGIQSVSSLPGDPTFSQTNNKYDIASYNRICKEFGIDPSSDFRYKRGENHCLGKVFIYVRGVGATPTYLTYPSEHSKFSDEGGKASDGNTVYFIRNDDGTENRLDFFVPDEAQGLTQAGLSRLNQSTEAFFTAFWAHRLMCVAAFWETVA